MSTSTFRVERSVDFNLIRWLDRLIVTGAVILFYMEIWGHEFAKSGWVPPIYGAYLLTLYVIMRIVLEPRLVNKALRSGLSVWTLVFLLLLVANYGLVRIGRADIYGPYIADVFNANLTSLAIIFCLLILFSIREVFRFSVYLIIPAVIAGSIINFFDLVDLTQRWSGFNLRAAGFYINPNISAVGLSLGFTGTVFFLDRRWRLPYYMIYLVGVVLTLSRGTIPIAVLLGIYLLMTGSFTPRSTLWGLLTGVLLLALIRIVIVSNPNYDRILLSLTYSEGIQDRINMIFNPFQTEFQFGVRDNVAAVHRDYYLERPILGQGLSSSIYVQKELTESNHASHIQYLHMLTEYGLLGLIILFTLPLSMMFHGGRFFLKKELIIFTMVYLIACLASHNMYDLRSLCFSYAFFGALINYQQGGD